VAEGFDWPYPADDLAPPAAARAVAAAEAAIGLGFPDDLRAFYLFANGFEGWLDPDAPASYLRILPVEEAASASTGYLAAAALGPMIVFADDGGAFGYVWDPGSAPRAYALMPLAASDRREITPIAADLAGFLAARAKGAP
jgi:hypothetical protein